MSAECYGAWNQKKDFDPPVHPKTPEQKERLQATLGKSFLFQALEGKDLVIVIDAMEEVRKKNRGFFFCEKNPDFFPDYCDRRDC